VKDVYLRALALYCHLTKNYPSYWETRPDFLPHDSKLFYPKIVDRTDDLYVQKQGFLLAPLAKQVIAEQRWFLRKVIEEGRL
jgi:hypothetical protein